MHNKNAQYSPPDINDTKNLWVFMVYIAAFPPKNDDMSRTAMIQKLTPLHLIVSLLIKIAIMAVVFVISVLPTVVCTLNMSKKDGINE